MGMDMDFQKIRNEFPAFQQQVFGKSLVYLDSAATTLKPKCVIDRLTQFYCFETANVHRGAHFLSDQATIHYEEARSRVQKFLNAKMPEEIVFVRGTTEGINLVAHCASKGLIQHGNEVIISEMEHHANIVPWQILTQEIGLKLKIIPMSKEGELLEEEFLRLLTPNTKFVSLVHCSNTLGTVNDIKKYIDPAHSVGAKVLIDGAQMVSSHPVDVQALDCDFYVFSGHKLFAPFGIGVVYGKYDLWQSLPPYQGGGSMISEVKFDHTTYQDAPHKFEAGTPAVAEAIALKSALDFVDDIGLDKISKFEKMLLDYATTKLSQIPGSHVIGQSPSKTNILTFVIDGVNSSDLGSIVNQDGIAIRAGHHCTQPLHRRLGLSVSARASFSIYNNYEDIDRFIAAIEKARRLLL